MQSGSLAEPEPGEEVLEIVKLEQSFATVVLYHHEDCVLVEAVLPKLVGGTAQ